MAQHHMAFTGTVTLPPSTLIQVIRDVVMALARHGFDRFFFVNGHGGNIAPVSTAFSEIHTELAEASAFRAPGGNAPPAELRCMLKHRSEERRVGKECVSTCRSLWSPYH